MHAVTVASLLGLAVIVFLYVVKRVSSFELCDKQDCVKLLSPNCATDPSNLYI